MSDTAKYTIVRTGGMDSLSRNIDDYPDGIVIPFDKPLRWTSADVVRKLKFKLQYYFKKKNLKVGHAGTLDPLATGLLIICIGKATKISESLQAENKEYIAEITFGSTTPSFDLEKPVDATFPWEHITLDLIRSVLPKFLGEQQQVPPLFSAKFVDGVRAYEMAREGSDVELKSSTINIYELEILDFRTPAATGNEESEDVNSEDDASVSDASEPVLKLRIRCSKGTYIRSLARDLGLALGSGAHLSSLRRTRSGGFSVDEGVTMDEILSFFYEQGREGHPGHQDFQEKV